MKYRSKKYNPESRFNLRIIAVGVFFSFLYLIIAGRAVYLQVICNDELAGRASREYQKTYEVIGKRGTIYDRNQNELAVSVDAVSIGIRPGLIADKNRTARLLAEALEREPAVVKQKLTAKRSFVWLERKAAPKHVAAVRELDLGRRQVEYVPENKRVYPNRDLAAQVVGFTGIDGHGLEGIEYAFDRYLKGASINRTVLWDAKRQNLNTGDGGGHRCDGNDLILSLDKTVQCIAENALAEMVKSSQADSGIAIVMVPDTGAVLAMANYPFFNPNVFNRYKREVWRNRAVTDAFEPGSTMKVFLAASAIDSGMCTANSLFFCEEGKYRVYDNLIHDSHEYGWLTLNEIIKYSSNIGAVKVSERIGKRQLWKTLRRFGFDSKTGISCPGSTKGMLSFYEQWTPVDTGSIAFGQGISTSAIQLVTAVSAIANGGLLVRPYVVDRVLTPDGRTIMEKDREIVRRVISERTARVMRKIMETVTREGGTGERATIPGYSVCGKTGTAQKLNAEGKYTNEDYIASFMGFAPSRDPAVSVLVVVNEPEKGHYGGTVAAPAFKKIVHDTLNYLGVPPDNNNGTDHMMVSIQKEVNG